MCEASSPDFKKKLLSLQIQIKDLLADDFEKAVITLKSHLHPEVPAYDEIIIVLERFRRINKAFQKGLLEFQIADTFINRLVNSFIFTLNNLKEKDLIFQEE